MNLKNFCYLLLILAVADSLSQANSLITWLFLINILTFTLYGADKYAARKSCSRIPESTLLLFSFVCGWPGALCGQALFRHKTQKQPFKTYFFVSVILNIVVVVALHWWYQNY